MQLYDQHIHSEFSLDSSEDLESYYKICAEKNLGYCITCEHFDPHTIITGKTWLADYEAMFKKISCLKDKYPTVTPLLGIEIGYRSEYLNEAIELVNKYDFDLIQFSLHDDGKVDFYMTEAFKDNYVNSLNHYFDLLIEAITVYKNYDVLSHIDYGFKTAHYLNSSLKISQFEDKLKQIFKIIIKDNKALEVNTKVEEKINDDSNIKYLLTLYKTMGGEKLTLSSDAHEKDRYMSSFDIYKRIIKECGFNKLSLFIKRKEYQVEI